MFETQADLEALQALIDRSYAAAGPHLLRIHDPQRRPSAEELAERLTGMRLLVLATVTADGRPITGPVDGIFHRGAWHFGSAGRLDALPPHPRPAAGERHPPPGRGVRGHRARARRFRWTSALPSTRALRENLLQIYVPRYGPEWEHDFLDARSSASGSDPPQYARIEAERMFAFRMP